jgi:hypothetical protein
MFVPSEYDGCSELGSSNNSPISPEKPHIAAHFRLFRGSGSRQAALYRKSRTP